MLLFYTFTISGDAYTTTLWHILYYGSMFFFKFYTFTITRDGYTTTLLSILCY